MKIYCLLTAFFALTFLTACQTNFVGQIENKSSKMFGAATPMPETIAVESQEIKKILESAFEQTRVTKSYDPAYVALKYPAGDVSLETGVCSDVVVRAFRGAGIDLQKEIHEDMTANFRVYPQKWNLKKADANIDHRRVPNLQTFFTRRGKSLAVTENGKDYQPGDVVAYDLDGKGMTHVALVSNLWNEKTKRFSIIHNIGAGALAEDALFNWKIIGHYRYF